MALTEAACRAAKTDDRPLKLYDANGLFLYVTATGLKSWRLKYRFAEREKKLVLGRYPTLSLKDARGKAAAARLALSEGRDPAAEKARAKARSAEAAVNSFGAIAEEWLGEKSRSWTPRFAKQMRGRTANAVRAFGKQPVEAITPMDVLALMRRLQARGAPSMAQRVLQLTDSIFAFAIATGRAQQNPAASIRGALPQPTRRRRPAALTLPKARATLEAIESVPEAWWPTLLCSRLTALTAVRPGVARLAEVGEFEELSGTEPLWRIPAAKMKLKLEEKGDARFDFVVPLSRQAAAVVTTALSRRGPRAKATWLFPGELGSGGPINENALSDLYRAAGLQGKHVPHGWRASFSTIMNEWAAEEGDEHDRRILDLMLAHFPDTVEVAYNRASYRPRRRALGQLWADRLLEGFPEPGSLLPPQG
ncbi:MULTISPECIES: tyrosine-type recombinase/integrase [Pacificimonas]|uniref:Integrase arm-type DNA-binding domain-containing protein n=1 Tax=Pacificimonas aurantium TaxID=1250540 RepID=A0ABS7WL15_9SPHN|nr:MULTISPECIES: integrase arm-type DNA-binding domain-containing protein [Pacificimonas]MBZ6379080.1 integrase arm-type DNA-binding domain-containing protein [Pacificimonas aurantium]